MPANLLLALALRMIAIYKQARDRQAALDPRTGLEDDQATPQREDFKTDAEIATLLGSESVTLQQHADELIAKYS